MRLADMRWRMEKEVLFHSFSESLLHSTLSGRTTLVSAAFESRMLLKLEEHGHAVVFLGMRKILDFTDPFQSNKHEQADDHQLRHLAKSQFRVPTVPATRFWARRCIDAFADEMLSMVEMHLAKTNKLLSHFCNAQLLADYVWILLVPAETNSESVDNHVHIVLDIVGDIESDWYWYWRPRNFVVMKSCENLGPFTGLYRHVLPVLEP